MKRAFDTDRAVRLRGIAAQFSPKMLDDAACRTLVITHLHGTETACPSCSATVPPEILPRWQSGKRCGCRSCGRSYYYTSGTVLDGLHISPTELVLFAVLVAFDLPTREIAAILRRDRGTINHWRQRLINLQPEIC